MGKSRPTFVRGEKRKEQASCSAEQIRRPARTDTKQQNTKIHKRTYIRHKTVRAMSQAQRRDESGNNGWGRRPGRERGGEEAHSTSTYGHLIPNVMLAALETKTL